MQVFHASFRSHLSILAYFDNIVICIILVLLRISTSFTHFWGPFQVCLLVVIHWSLSNLAYLNNAVICMVLVLLQISTSPTLFSTSLRTIPSVPTTNGITISLCSIAFPAYWQYLSIFSLSLIFTLWSTGTAKSTR